MTGSSSNSLKVLDFDKAFIMCRPFVNRVNFVQLLGSSADRRDHDHKASSSTSMTSRVGSRYGNSREVLAPASTPALMPGMRYQCHIKPIRRRIRIYFPQTKYIEKYMK